MPVSVLERLLLTERYRPRDAPRGGFSVPMMLERSVIPEHEPLVVSNTRGSFVQTRRTKEGTARYAFFECRLEDEGSVLGRLFSAMQSVASTPGWPSTAASVSEALARFPLAKSIVLSESLVAKMLGDAYPLDQVRALMGLQGYLAIVEGRQVLAHASIPQGCAIVTASPQALGVYTRVGDYLGLQLLNVRQTILTVRVPDDVA